ncbi:MAG: glycosyltransferase [Lachnospiraceae bacterium]|nr:glycosyltransferase [Lachnospiraceae bacterium]MDE6252713.1 glycosyltransferase [Lachnospiraceae bacterium]
MQDLITVIVAVYKTEPYIRRCLDSIVSQTYKNMEVLLIDDGSPDGAPAICDEYAEKYDYIQAVHKENGGVSSVRNLGIDMAKGKYLCFIDSDDYIGKDYLKHLHAAIAKYNADVSVCGHYKEKENGELTGMVDKKSAILDNEEAMCRMFYNNNFGAYPWNKLFRKDIVDKYKIRYDLELRMSQDLVWVTTYMKYCDKVAYVAEPLYYYAFNEQSVCRKIKSSGNFDRKNLITLKAHEMTRELIKDKSKKIKDAFRGRYVCTYMRLYVNMFYSNTFDKELVKEVKKNIRENLFAFLTRPAYGLFDRASAVLIAISPGLFRFLFGIVNKLFKVSV